MHRLHLLRHAKSNYPEGVDDSERPLSRRGREAARRVAGFAAPPRILYEDGLYLAGRAALIRRLRGLDESLGAVMVIGHNPGLHELALALAAPDSPRYRTLATGKFPTTARASFAIEGPWAALGQSRHQLTDFVTAKSLDD
jgi:phosphohistidine phosphatase